MRKTRWFHFINSIAGQLLILLILAMGMFLTGIYISVQAAREAPLAPPIMLYSERQIGIAEAFALLPVDAVEPALQKLRNEHPTVTYELLSSSDPVVAPLEWIRRNIGVAEQSPPPSSMSFLFRLFDPLGGPPKNPDMIMGFANPQAIGLLFARTVHHIEDNRSEVTVYSRLSDEHILSARITLRAQEPPNHALENILIFSIVCTLLLLLWAIIFLIRPLRRLAQVTNNIAKENAKPQMAEVAGPTELRVASMALNKMQDRIHQLIEDRTRMLAAVGHDLRTPVTRLRLRADTVEPEDLRKAFLRDLTMMDGLLTRLMTYFSKGDTGEKPVRLELSSLVDSLAYEWSDSGEAVELTDYTNLTIRARPNDLTRLVDNLIDNAVKYAGACEISLKKEGDFACLRVIDHGPGIAQEDRLLLQEPFARGDKARTMNDKSGFGLGLAIVRKAVESHDATLEMADTEGGGLTVIVRFPLAK
ncbi:ATP-binding protein [uncultured Cohaesibacter sp.]|uniref:ATP-binding protein n=1 Tax=uncultured Cohaesibacter sp. TaxID=1002546 RepID=UPI0029C6F606|nr:ATP-binding protein [uncultured Cohaesibacter sp.]